MLQGIKENIQRFQYASNGDSQSRRARLLPENRHFTIVANDCWGAEVYKDFGLPFESPFIGLFVAGPCYIKLVEDFRRIVTSPLRFTAHSRYPVAMEMQAKKKSPIGLLADDVEIYFLHYETEAEAASKWNRRVERINWDRLFFKISADSLFPFTDDELRRFDALNTSRKFIFTTRSLPDVKCAITTPDYLKDGKLMYERTHQYVDMAAWLNMKEA